MNVKTAKKFRQIMRSEFKREMAAYYALPFFTRLKWAYCVLFRVYPGKKKR
jgi:hypothetical protein